MKRENHQEANDLRRGGPVMVSLNLEIVWSAGPGQYGHVAVRPLCGW